MIFTKQRIKRILESKILNRMGISIYTVGLVRYLKHHLWLLKIGKIPSTTVVYGKIREVSKNDLNLCERLLEAFGAAKRDASETDVDPGPLWSSVIKNHYARLYSVLELQRPEALAVTLSSMFRESFVYGIASGNLFRHYSSSLIRSKLWLLNYCDNIVALAEYLAVVRTESPEQGAIGYGLKDGLNALVAKIEDAIGVSIGFPDVGAPYGILANNSLITMEHPEHVYVMLRIKNAIENYLSESEAKDLNILEIGGGVGDLAYWVLKSKKMNIDRYTIVDLPVVSVLQGYFLSKALGESKVSFYGETKKKETIISLMPTYAIQTMTEKEIDVVINENSMPEMTEQSVEAYIQFMKRSLRGVFFSYNQEAYAPVNGIPQILVPEIVNRVKGFYRLSRNLSWMRNGYVEEIYRPIKD